MITISRAKEICREKYIELWGKDWVDERIGCFVDDTRILTENDVLLYGIAEDASYDQSQPITFEEFSKVTFGENNSEPCQHYTKFRVDLNTGELEVLIHR